MLERHEWHIGEADQQGITLRLGGQFRRQSNRAAQSIPGRKIDRYLEAPVAPPRYARMIRSRCDYEGMGKLQWQKRVANMHGQRFAVEELDELVARAKAARLPRCQYGNAD